MVRTRARGRGNIQYKSRQGRRIGEMEGHCQERHEGMEDARGLDQYRTRYPTPADGAENRTERRSKKKNLHADGAYRLNINAGIERLIT